MVLYRWSCHYQTFITHINMENKQWAKGQMWLYRKVFFAFIIGSLLLMEFNASRSDWKNCRPTAPLSFIPKACAQEPKLGRITHHHQAAWDLGRFSASGIKGLQLRGSRGIDCQLGSEGRSSSKLGSDLQDMEDLEWSVANLWRKWELFRIQMSKSQECSSCLTGIQDDGKANSRGFLKGCR